MSDNEEKLKEIRKSVQQHYESFKTYLKNDQTPLDLIPVIASNLTIAATQKEAIELGIKIDGDVYIEPGIIRVISPFSDFLHVKRED
jgi:hypothetical protein